MDAPLPLPLADPLAQAGVPLVHGVPQAAPGDDAAARFATLLELARLTLEPAGTGQETGQPALHDRPEGAEDAAPAAPASALDGLLFLAAVVPAAPTPASAAVPESVDEPHPAPRAGTPALSLILPKGAASTDDALANASAQPTQGSGAAIATEATHRDTRLSTPFDDSNGAASSAKSPRASAEPAFVLDVEAQSPAKDAMLAAGMRSTPEPAMRDVATPAVQVVAPHTTLAHATLQPAPALAIDTPVTHPRFREDAASHLATLVTRGIERAELRVTPPELGPVEVRIDLSNGEASFAIVATQPATRDALEQALPLLRDLLAAQGLTLGQASVHDGRPESQGNGSPAASGAARGDAVQDPAPEALVQRTVGPRRLVDVFA